MSGFKKLGLLPSCMIGIAAAIAGTVLLCLVLTPLFLRGLLPLGSGSECACAAAGVAVFAAVFLTARLRGRQAMPMAGIIIGGTVLLAALLCALGGSRTDLGSWLLRLVAAAAAGGIIGAVMSIHSRTAKRRRPRR